MRYIDAMNMNMTTIQAAIAKNPASGPWLQAEFMKCAMWVGQYNQTRQEFGLNG